MDFVLVVAMVTMTAVMAAAAPCPAEVLKMKSKAKWMVEQLVVRLNKDFQVPPGLTVTSPVDEVGGLSSVVSVLESYNSLISESLDGVSQIKSDVGSLSGFLRQWTLSHCGGGARNKPASIAASLQKLHRRKEFVHTVSMEAIVRLKDYLSRMVKNLENLDNC